MSETKEVVKLFRLKDSTYDVLSGLVKYVLPGLGTLYFAIATIWGLPYGDQVLGTIVALEAFLGVVLGISKKAYNAEEPTYDGDVLVDVVDDEGSFLTVALERPVDEIRELESVKFRVITQK